MKIQRKRRQNTFQMVDVTPMADVVFLLLIFFMLSSTFVIQSGIKINLPKAKSSKMQPEEKVILSISKDNKIYINDRRVKLEALVDDIRRNFVNKKDKLLILKADKRVSHGMVVSVLDKAKLAGAEKLAIASENIKSK